MQRMRCPRRARLATASRRAAPNSKSTEMTVASSAAAWAKRKDVPARAAPLPQKRRRAPRRPQQSFEQHLRVAAASERRAREREQRVAGEELRQAARGRVEHVEREEIFVPVKVELGRVVCARRRLRV